MQRNSISSQVAKRVRTFSEGEIFFTSDFADIGTATAIKQALFRLCKEQSICRAAKGVYFVPEYDNDLGLGLLFPHSEKIAMAIAQKDGIQIIPTEDFALNGLGLSTQVQTNCIYLTNGGTHKVILDNGTTINFVHTSDSRLFRFKSDLFRLIVLAMKAIGENNISKEDLSLLKSHLSRIENDKLKHDLALAQGWIKRTLNS